MTISNDSKPQDEDLIALGRLRRMLGGVSRKTIHKWLCAKILPAPIQVRGRNYWVLGEIRAWIASQKRVEYEAA